MMCRRGGLACASLRFGLMSMNTNKIWKPLLGGLVACLAVLALLRPALFPASEGSNDSALIQELTAKVEGLEQSLLKRIDAIDARLELSGQPQPIISQGEELRLLQEIDYHASSGDSAALEDALLFYLEQFEESENAHLARKMLYEVSAVGRDVPGDWQVERMYQGSEAELNGVDGLKVLLFWELWCPHCREEIPRMQRLHSSLKMEGGSVVALTEVNGESSDAQVAAFIDENGIGYPVAKISAKLKARFNVSGVPAAAIVADGRIVWRGHPARLSQEMLQQWLSSGEGGA